jgi:hypothetical protein
MPGSTTMPFQLWISFLKPYSLSSLLVYGSCSHHGITPSLHQQYMVNCSSRVRKVLKELTKILLESFNSLWNLAIVSSYASRMVSISSCHIMSIGCNFLQSQAQTVFFDARLTCLIHSGFM